MGNHLSVPEYRVFSESVKRDIERLKENMRLRIPEIEGRIQKEKERFLSRANSSRKEKGPIEIGQVIFLKDFSVPKSGRARKFRPRFLKSPHIVLSCTDTSAVTMRLADGFVSRHHPDDMLQYRGDDKIPELFSELPPSVMEFLGKPLSTDSLINLAKTDRLDPIYVDKVLPTPNVIITRSKSKKKKEKAIREVTEILLENDNQDEELDVVKEEVVSAPMKKVKFSDLLT